MTAHALLRARHLRVVRESRRSHFELCVDELELFAGEALDTGQRARDAQQHAPGGPRDRR